jgi:membrane protease YdiL (CAAX protease family)
MCTLQTCVGRWIFTDENLFIGGDADGNEHGRFDESGDDGGGGGIGGGGVRTLNVARIFDVLLMAPLREEFFFRGILFSTVYRRVIAARATTTPTTTTTTTTAAAAKVMTSGGVLMDAAALGVRGAAVCAAGSAAAFSAVHLLNLSFAVYSSTYIALQLLLGALMGGLFALHVARTTSLVDALAIHVVNNVTSLFVPLSLTFSLDDYLISLSLMETVVVYVVLICLTLRAIHRDDEDAAAAAAAAAATAAAAKPVIEGSPTRKDHELKKED